MRFAIDPTVQVPPKDQLELKQSAEAALVAIQRLYPDAVNERDFRRYFVQIVGAAQVGLVGNPAFPDVGKQSLAGTVGELIDQEGARIKHRHLCELTGAGAAIAALLLLLYVVAGFAVSFKPWLGVLREFDIVPKTVACFAIMLVGCCLGVILSYAARTTTLGLADLVTPDSHQLRPLVRLLVSCGWAMVFAYFLTLEIVVFQVGDISTSSFRTQPTLAFLLGVIFGLSNLTLPGAVMKKVGDLLPGK